MRDSIGGGTRESRSRLESAKEALRCLSDTIGRSQLHHSMRHTRLDEDRLRIFAYCFGTRIAPGHDDLFGTMLATRQVDISAEVERRKREYVAEARRQASGYSDLESLARGVFGSRTVDQFKGALRSDAEQEIRQRITAEIAHLLRAQASKIERTVLNLREFADLFDADRGTDLRDFEALIYGSTPLRAATEQVVARFLSITRNPNADEVRTLLVISDGQPTDGDPLPQFRALKDAGVAVVSCYVTNADVADPRMLLGRPDEHWDAGARLMFDAASPLDESGEFASYLLRHGWAIERDAKMFVQINHSDVLEEFVSAVGSRLEEREEVGLLPVGQ